jgi:hypothetical protein
MSSFDSKEYELMIGELIHDTFYVSLSTRGRIKGIRQFSEILVRKILNIGSSDYVTLGNVVHRREFKELTENKRIYLKEAIEKIRVLGNDGTHTQHTDSFSSSELEKVKDGFFELYAYLFIDYFLKFPMTLLSPAAVMFNFSLLPPIIRYKTLQYLYNENANLQIANRYCLAIIKAFDKNTAFEWLESNKEKLLSIPYPTEEEAHEYYTKIGVPVSPTHFQVPIQLWKYNNVYDLLVGKIKDPRTALNESGKMYSDFEEAKIYWLNERFFSEIQEVDELNNLIDFVYLGREI